MPDLRKRQDAKPTNRVGMNISLTIEHVEKLRHRKYILGTDISVTIKKALNYYFDEIEDKEIENYLKGVNHGKIKI